jgi:hypothetical protein
MTVRRRRVWVTAGTTGWARAPYDPDRDPSLPPDTEHPESPDMPTDHTLTPADIAARCRILGCGVTIHGANYRIVPPADATTEDGSRPSVVHFPADAEFRSKADRALSVRNLRNNGVDVMEDRDWTERPAAEPEPAPEIPKLAPIPGPRPTAAWSKRASEPAPQRIDPVTEVTPEDVDRSAEIVAALGHELARLLLPLNERLDKLATRLEAVESRPSVGAMRVGQLDESVGNLARRVNDTERAALSARTGLEHANDAVKALTDKVGGNAARATNLGAELVSIRQRLDALEAGTAAEPAPDPNAWMDEMRRAVLTALSPYGAVFLPRATIAEIMGMEDSHDSPEIKRLSYVLKMMKESGELESTGAKSQTRWRLTRKDES